MGVVEAIESVEGVEEAVVSTGRVSGVDEDVSVGGGSVAGGGSLGGVGEDAEPGLKVGHFPASETTAPLVIFMQYVSPVALS